MVKSEIRYRIDTLIKGARTTENPQLREEWVTEAINLLDELVDQNISEPDPIDKFISERLIITSGKIGAGRTKKLDIWNAFLLWRQNTPGIPFITKHAFYEEFRERGVPIIRSNGADWFGILLK